MHVTWCQRVGGEVITDSNFFIYTLEIRHGCSASMIAFGYVSICIDGVVKKLNVTVVDCKHNVT